MDLSQAFSAAARTALLVPSAELGEQPGITTGLIELGTGNTYAADRRVAGTCTQAAKAGSVDWKAGQHRR